MEFGGNSSADYNLQSGFVSSDNAGDSESQEMRSDSDDFNDSGEDEAFRDKIRSSDSRTFNEDEATYKAEKREGTQNNVSGPDYGSNAGNQGTANNNWDANDQMQRGNGLHDDDEEENNNSTF